MDRLAAASQRELGEAIAVWDAKLGDLGGDPAHEDWAAFRPLRLSREEDWSDWLAHLLHLARSGRFAARLLGGDAADAPMWSTSSYSREFVAERYRADIVLRFTNSEYAHIEVKVGDRQLEKTAGTGDAVQRREPGTCRADVLLLPEEDRHYWDAAADSRWTKHGCITVRTWTDVARALRACLIEPGYESTSWRVWARAFLGAVEQSLLGFPPVGAGGNRAHPASAKTIAYLGFLRSLEAS